MASSRFFPSRVQSLLKFTRKIAFTILPQGAGAPLLGVTQGVKSVSRTAAGAFTITLQDQYKALVDAQISLQFATPPSATPASVTFGPSGAVGPGTLVWTAGTGLPGVAGDKLQVEVNLLEGNVATATGYWDSATGMLFHVWPAQASGVSNGGPGALATAIIPLLDPAIMTVAVGASGALCCPTGAVYSLAGGAGNALSVQFGAIDLVSAKTVKIQISDPSTGVGTDIAANAGNIINVELFVQVL